ncbi:hypothetical protein RJ639_028666 [Escallonia herrerae]|uniref:FAR1 domain-containing protein n=1 Tax=Escallonia herrerae TaxID=1293975 RepID=A0AA88X774_9ASTE|nr:hypothetical protein RJ639_028666 [Escallonia herrerae]
MEFDSEQCAFDYYSEYAHRVGFNVRKQYVKKRVGVMTRRTLCRSKQDEWGIVKRRENVYYHCPVSRVDCESTYELITSKEAILKVISFNAKHNHTFVPSIAKHVLSSCLNDYEDEDEWMLAWNQILKTYSFKTMNG